MHELRKTAPRLVPLLALAIALATAGPALGQAQTGNIFIKVADDGGAILPGVSVTLTGMGAPRTQVTNASGEVRYLNLSPGSYSAAATLQGFAKVTQGNIVAAVGQNTAITLKMAMSSVKESIVVTGESPILDTRKTTVGANISKVELESVPSGRDPWVILSSVPGVQIDRVNVGGTESGQQSGYVARGAGTDQGTWNVDGVNITDMGALGSSPSYYDFDSFEEMNVSTGGSDVAVQTAGAQLNMVTKRGTNDVHGSARVIMSDRQLQSTNLSDELAAQLARSGSTQQGNALDNLQDYGMEMGGPLIKDKLWLWGSYGRSQINLVTAGGYPDKTLLVGFGGKLNAQLIPENTFTASYSDNDKQKQGRSAGPTRPPETSFTQTGPTKLYKLEDSHIFSSNVFATVAYSRVIGGFGFTTPGQTVAYQDESSIWHNSYYQYQTTRNQTQFTLAPSFFARTGDIGHEIKVGFNYRRTPISSVTAWPGGMISFAPGMYAADRGIAGFIRDSNRDVDQTYYSGYISDTLTMNKLTVNVGVRYDYQKGQNNPVALSDPKYNTTVWPEPGLKGFTVAGTDAVTWKDFAPRLSATYAINDKTLARVSYARFVNQLGGTIPTWNSNAANGGTYLYYYWDDANGNKKVDPGEVDFGAGLYSSYNVGPNGPNSAQAYNKTDPNLKAPKTDEIILGFERQLAPTIVASVNGTWRHFSDQIEYAPLSADGSRILNPGDYTCAVRGPYPVPGGGSPQMITVCNPKPGVAGEARMETNRPGLTYDYWALDFNLVKRYADKWMARFNFTYSDERQHNIDQGQTDPANLITGTEAAGGLVVYGTGTVSGKTYVYVNSRWSVNLSGMYTLPYDFNLSTSLLARQGYPVPYYIRVAASGVPSYAQVKNYQLGNVDDVRLPAVVEWDLGLSKVVKTGPLSITLMVDCFNVLNRNTVLQRSPRVYDAAGSPVASNANDNLIYEQQSPRLFRFGARLSF